VRDLHVVGLTADGQHLLLAGSDDGAKASHRIAVDARFEAALRGQRLGESAPAPALSPRDIQARLRAGATVEEVAAEAGLPVSRVQRFAGPVFSERDEELRKVYLAHQHGRRGTSTVALEQAVTTALEQTAFTKPETLEWTAYRRADATWVAKVSIVIRGRRKSAEWVLAPDGATVRPLDAWASSLGHVEALAKPAGPAKVARPAKVAVKPMPAKASVAKSAKPSVAKAAMPSVAKAAKPTVAKAAKAAKVPLAAKVPAKVPRARSAR
jgi:hypothetical protein